MTYTHMWFLQITLIVSDRNNIGSCFILSQTPGPSSAVLSTWSGTSSRFSRQDMPNCTWRCQEMNLGPLYVKKPTIHRHSQGDKPNFVAWQLFIMQDQERDTELTSPVHQKHIHGPQSSLGNWCVVGFLLCKPGVEKMHIPYSRGAERFLDQELPTHPGKWHMTGDNGLKHTEFLPGLGLQRISI